MRSGSLWMRFVTSFYRRAVLMVRELDALENVTPPMPGRIALMSRGEIDAYRRFRPGAGAADLEVRLARGDVAVVAWLDDRIGHAAWVATGRAYVSYLGRDLLLKPDELLVYDSHTLPDLRESGIAKARMDFVFREYRTRGYRRCFAIVAMENVIGRRAVEAGGYHAVARYHRLRLGPLDRCWPAAGSDPTIPRLGDSSK